MFEKNKVFCLACKSKTLGSYAIKAGAKVYVGFDAVPFSLNGNMIGKRAFRQIKFELRSAVYDSLLSAIENNYSFNQLSRYLKLRINKKRIDLMLNKEKKGKERRIKIARILGSIKNGITLFGDGEIRVND
ncbi:MAG: hypothetical protein KAW87_01975 [Candidatus Cloacimonetes bacterium]|nr:hypothetical protein [Candidatus Cloacimonadota bacterium]